MLVCILYNAYWYVHNNKENDLSGIGQIVFFVRLSNSGLLLFFEDGAGRHIRIFSLKKNSVDELLIDN